MIHSQNPYSLQMLKKIPCDNESSIKKKYQLSRKAQGYIQNVDIETRIKIVNKILNQLHKEKNKLARVFSEETGTPIIKSKALLTETIRRSKWFIYQTETLKPLILKLENAFINEIHRESRGVILIISSYNSPISQTMWSAIPALIAGNAVLHKPSEYSSTTAESMQEIIEKAKVPKGIFQTIYGDKSISKPLLDNKPDVIIFSGSYDSGTEIAKYAAKYNIKLNLELGGKDYMIVLPDADLEKTSDAIVKSLTKFSGQSCNSVENLYVHKSAWRALFKLVKKKIQKIKIGNPLDNDTDMGPLTTKLNYNRFSRLIKDALGKGAKIIVKKDIVKTGFCVSPIILSKCNKNMGLMREEIFCPIIPAFEFSSLGKIVNQIKDSEFGLGLSIWSSDVKKIKNIIKCNHLRFGTIVINELPRTDIQCPWGGFKKTGNDRILGKQIFYSLTQPLNLRYKDET